MFRHMRPPLRSLTLKLAAGASLSAGFMAPAPAAAQLRSKLPLVVIGTAGGIPNEPKAPARVRVIDRPGRLANRPSDPGNVYAGRAGIETRGHSSQLFAKKQYGLELRDRRGDGRDVGLLGMPADDDWVLSASHSDKTLMRNALAYRTARTVFGRYAPYTRYVEVVLNGNYRGVYVLTQKIELGAGRVEPDGGWILELAFGYQASGERHYTSPRTGRPLLYVDPDDPGRRRARAIRADVVRFERALYGERLRHPEHGWRSRLNRPRRSTTCCCRSCWATRTPFTPAPTFTAPRAGGSCWGPCGTSTSRWATPRSTTSALPRMAPREAAVHRTPLQRPGLRPWHGGSLA